MSISRHEFALRGAGSTSSSAAPAGKARSAPNPQTRRSSSSWPARCCRAGCRPLSCSTASLGTKSKPSTMPFKSWGATSGTRPCEHDGDRLRRRSDVARRRWAPGCDLQQCAALSVAMVASLGLAGPSPLLYLAARDETEALLRFPGVRSAANAEIEAAYAACRALLSRHRAVLDETAAKPRGTAGCAAATDILAAHLPEERS
jgi:hypothetical protein